MKLTDKTIPLPYVFTTDAVLEHIFQDWSNRQFVNETTAGKTPDDTITLTVTLRFKVSAQEAKAKLKEVLERERKGEDQ